MSTQLVPASEQLTPQEQAFVTAYRKTGNQSAAYAEAFPNAAKWSPGALAVEASRFIRKPNVALRLASLAETVAAVAQQHALDNLQRTQNLAAIADDVENETAARLAVAERAIRTQHEVAGTIKSGASVVVNVDARRIDAQALGAWDQIGPDGLTGAERFRASQALPIEPEAGT